MPELPEVETIVRKLQRGEPAEAGLPPYPTPVGTVITGAWGNWANSIRPSIPTVTNTLPGHRIQSLNRRGKYLVFGLEPTTTSSARRKAKPVRRYLILHLKMSGRLSVLRSDAPRHKHVHFTCDFDTGYTLHFQDARKWGRVYYVDDMDEVTGHLGPEPLDRSFTLRRFRPLIGKKTGRLKDLLLDQSFIAGLGNIYADEALWWARLHPFTRAGALSDGQVAALHKSIRRALTNGIRHNGAAIDWVYPEGNYQHWFRVYGRTGKPCRRCRTPIERVLIGQRGTHFCPQCQQTV